jgi:hypothetical protein
LSPEEVALLIDSAQTRFHRIVLMTLYGTGVRRAELALWFAKTQNALFHVV